ncbi:MAG TPA: hypothetical protein VHH92_03990, partial [Actinomycetota bacterium]|nr:hypothetical protein [Actinomycetota bacterium]
GRRCSTVAAALALILGLSLATPAAAEEPTHSPNVTHVLNHPHRARAVDGPLSGGGTDIEFATLSVAVRDASDTPICFDKRGRPVTSGKPCSYRYEQREFAVAGSYDNGLQIVDITRPTAPVTVGVYDCVIRQGDVQVFTRNGRTYVTYTHDDPYTANTSSACYQEARALGLFGDGVNPAGTFVADITDPYDPTTVSFISERRGSHNQTVAPGGRYLYNSNSDIGRVAPAGIEVFDISDFSNPRKVYTLPLISGLDSHDITFNEDGTRAYSAAITHTLVLDTTNLAQPSIIGRIVDPAINIHHQSDPVTLTDPTTGLPSTFLVVTDELAGAAGNAVCPGGGLHVYDITGHLERAPVKVGAWFMPDVRFTGTGNLTCTSHVLRMYPEEKVMTIAWYNAGVRVVDISGLVGLSAGVDETAGNVGVGMRELGYAYFPNSDTWSVKTNRIEPDGSFYLYGNDLNRGLDIYRFDAGAAATADGGSWLTPDQALARAQALGVTSTSGETGPWCLARGGLAVG